MTGDLVQQANVLATRVSEATALASNELQLQHAVEGYLETACQLLGLPWAPFSINVSLRGQGGKRTRFSDAVHGAVIIEYKKPGGFRGREGHLFGVAKKEAQDYAALMQGQEGRDIDEYILVAWDGSHICFGKMDNGAWQWENLVGFDQTQAHRLLRLFQDDGRPLVHPGDTFNSRGVGI